MKKILVIDDDIGVRESLCDILEMSGYAIFSANNGKEGYNIIMEEKPDLVICDVNMPVLNGFELLGALSQLESKFLLPTFIFLTAKVETVDVRKGMSMGADDYITKPYDHNELLRIIKMRLEKRSNLLGQSDKNNHQSNNIISVKNNNINKLAISSSDGLEMVNFDKIIRCEADRAYCNFYLINNKRITVSKPLAEFESSLVKNNFYKVHKSHVVNLGHIEKYIRGTNAYLVMSDGSSVPVSSRKRDEVLTLLRQI